MVGIEKQGSGDIQWWRYTRALQVKWPGWKIHRPGSALTNHVYCFALVIVWTLNKNVTISDRFICFILMVKRRWRHVYWGRQLKIKVNYFLGKKCNLVTWLENFLTWKWPGSFTALAPPLVTCVMFAVPSSIYDVSIDCGVGEAVTVVVQIDNKSWTEIVHFMILLRENVIIKLLDLIAVIVQKKLIPVKPESQIPAQV